MLLISKSSRPLPGVTINRHTSITKVWNLNAELWTTRSWNMYKPNQPPPPTGGAYSIERSVSEKDGKQWCTIPGMSGFRFWFQHLQISDSDSRRNSLIPLLFQFQPKFSDSDSSPIWFCWFRFRFQQKCDWFRKLIPDSDSESCITDGKTIESDSMGQYYALM